MEMNFDVLKEFYVANKKIIITILVILILMGILKVIGVVRKSFAMAGSLKVEASDVNDVNDRLLKTYDEYLNFTYDNHIDADLSAKDFDKNDYIVYFFDNVYCQEVVDVNDVRVKSSNVVIYFNYYVDCDRSCSSSYTLFFIPIDKNKFDDLPEVEVEFENTGDKEVCEGMFVDKPILYLYPTKDMEVTVQLENSDFIKTSYPRYNDGWKVFVKADGSLYDQDGKYYYALYWDEYNHHTVDFSTGFYVTRENATQFLEEKLSIIGLNDKERNEFIMYWLPKLEDNKESLVYFELTNEREKYNKLNISPSPDSMLRVNMHVKKVNGYVDIKEQDLESFERVGFVVVEWGGTIY